MLKRGVTLRILKSEELIHSDGRPVDNIRVDLCISENVAANSQTNIRQKHQ